MIPRGFVLSGSLAQDEIAELAASAEERSYTSVWLTVPASQTEPGELVRVALTATTRIEIGLGVIPLDRFSPESIREQIRPLREAYDRIVVGVGVGRTAAGAATLVERTVRQLKDDEPAVRIGVGTYNAEVLAAAGETADALVLNWMTPERMRWAVGQAEATATAAGRSRPSVYLYLSSTAGAGGARSIDDALAAFRQYQYHRLHQDAMAAQETVGVAVESASDVNAALARYEGAIPIINPVGAATVSERRRVLDVFAPDSSSGSRARAAR